MEERARRKQAKEEGELARAGAGRGKRKYAKRDANRESTSQAVLEGFAVKKTSKKINYDRLEVAFNENGDFKIPTGLADLSVSAASLPSLGSEQQATSSNTARNRGASSLVSGKGRGVVTSSSLDKGTNRKGPAVPQSKKATIS